MTTRNPRNSGRPSGRRASVNRQDLEWRRSEALRLRRRGWSITRIAIELDVSASVIDHDLEIVLERHQAANVTMLRALENERLDYALEACMDVIDSSPGPKNVVAAVGRLVQISARRSSLNGLDVPIRIDHTVHEVTEQDRELAELIREAETRNQMTGQRLTTDWHREAEQIDQHVGEDGG